LKLNKKNAILGALLAAELAALISCNKTPREPKVSEQAIKQEVPANQSISPLEIKIATFNIQVFGMSKINNPEVMDVLTKIVRNYDIIAVQEIRDETMATLPYFLGKINEIPGDRYAYIESARLGRTDSKEQYAYIYNTKTISFGGKSYVFNDTHDVFEREPYLASFSSNKFDFILVNIHTKPTNAKQEIQSLVDVVKDASVKFNEKDIIVLGDYNADGSYFSEATSSGFRGEEYMWIVPDSFDTTVSQNNSYTYDRIVFQRAYTLEDFTGKVDVFKFDTEYNLASDFAKEVSDHYPVSAQFYTDRDSD
jgi:deoxyribonuclease-1-like protein